MLCGALSGVRVFDRQIWLSHVAGHDDLSPFEAGEPMAAVQELVGHTHASLEQDDLSFGLLLPGDDQPLAERAMAFSRWCRGFLSGFGLAGIADLTMLGEDAREFLRDVERFVSLDVGNEGEVEERALLELTEFTRMGVLIVRTDVARLPSAAEAPSGTC